MHITIRQLQVFLEVAAKGTVTHAAKTLHISQPAASMALSDLEKQLNEVLFDRQGNRLLLNDQGRMLLPMAQDVVARVHDIGDMFATRNRKLAGRLRIGASSTLGNYLIPQMLGEFVDEVPGARLSLDVGNTEDIIQEILDFKVDVGFVEDICQHHDIESHSWREDRLAVFCAPHYPLAQLTDLQPEHLRQERWILRENGSGTRHVFENAIANVLENIDVFLELGHSEAIKRAVESGIGISCLSVITIEDALQRGTLVELPTPFLNLNRCFYRLVHKQKYRSALLQQFLTVSDRK